MKRLGKSILSAFLVAVMLISMVPITSTPVEAKEADGTAARLVEVVKNELATFERKSNGYTKYGDWFNAPYSDQWCAMFVSWCAKEAGIKTSVIPKYSGCGDFRRFFKGQNRWIARKAGNPKPGDIIHFTWDDEYSEDYVWHVGIVTKVDSKRVYTIEGNSANRVADRNYALDDKQIIGYGRPGFSASSAPVPSKLTSPVISESNYYGGKKVAITPKGSPATQTINWQSKSTASASGSYSSKTATASSPVTLNLTSSAYVYAYASASNYSNSSTVNKNVTVNKVTTPSIKNPVYSASEARVEIAKGNSADIVLYTTDGTNPTFNTSTGAPTGNTKKYDGAIPVTSNLTIKAIGIRNGLASSGIATKVITIAAPETPVVSRYQTAEKIPVGNTVSVNWPSLPHASTYEANLYRAGSSVSIGTVTTSGNLASFTLPDVGTYEIRVRALNFVGASEPSYPPISVQAMPDVLVSFLNDDGTKLVPDRYIKYGEVPQYPTQPSKKGHDFSGWTVAPGTPLYVSMEISAVYTPKIYSVDFYNTNGALMTAYSQKIEYSKPADLPPESVLAIAPYHAFLGWHISPESEGTDYTAVDGNMRIYATQAWANPNLPVGILDVTATKDSAALNSNAIRYVLDVTLTSNDGSTPAGWLMTVLKTQEGRMVASRNDAIRLGGPMTVVIDSEESASIAEVVVVGRNGVKTGGALSELRSAAITELSGYVPGPWSEWTTEQPDDYDEIQEKKQYRYKTKETATSTTSKTPPAGYTYDKTDSTVGSWSAWSDTKYTASTTDAKKREVETRSVVANYSMRYYRYQSATSPYPRWYLKNKVTPGTNGTRESYGVYEASQTWSVSRYNAATIIANGDLSSGTVAGYNKSGGRGLVESSGSGAIWFWVSTNNKTQYRYRDTTYVHHFYKISDWSDWVDEKPSSYHTLEERTVYRSRKMVPVSEAVDGTGEISGERYTVQGTLPADYDFSGRSATIFVYKDTNSDPNEEQRQFVGQTTILPDNGYNFSFIPREPISTKIGGTGTGDFIVALALEGSEKLTNIDVIKAPRPEYTVTFKADGLVLGEPQLVLEGENAVVPAVPEKTGYFFTGWDDSPTNINGNRTLNAQFLPMKFVVVLVDFANGQVDMNTDYTYGDILGLPEKESEGKIFKGWYTLEGETKIPVAATEFVVTDHTLLIADWETAVFTVDFVDQDGLIISSQEVEYNESATPPDPLVLEDMVFLGWETDTVWWRVTADVTVRPILAYPETVETPTIEFPDYQDPENPGDYIDEDEPEEEEGELEDLPPYIPIYIPMGSGVTTFAAIDGEEGVDYMVRIPIEITALDAPENTAMPEGFTHQFVEGTEILVFSNISITMMAVAQGKNDSETVIIEVPFIDPFEGMAPPPWEISLYAESVYTLPGSTVEIPVYISSVEGIAQMNLGQDFDSSALTFIESVQGPAFEPDDTTRKLITMTYQVAEDAALGDYELVITAYAKDAEGKDVDIRALETYVVVYENGDINHDGEVNAKDVTVLRRHLAGGFEEDSDFVNVPAGDCNRDGSVDAKDVTRLRRYLAGGWENDDSLD